MYPKCFVWDGNSLSFIQYHDPEYPIRIWEPERNIVAGGAYLAAYYGSAAMIKGFSELLDGSSVADIVKFYRHFGVVLQHGLIESDIKFLAIIVAYREIFTIEISGGNCVISSESNTVLSVVGDQKVATLMLLRNGIPGRLAAVAPFLDPSVTRASRGLVCEYRFKPTDDGSMKAEIECEQINEVLVKLDKLGYGSFRSKQKLENVGIGKP